MNRQDAIKALVKSGKSKDVREVIDSYSDRASRRFDEVRSDAGRTDEYKKWALAVASSQIARSLNAELEKMAGQVIATDRGDAEKVFGVAGLSGDPASLVISRRDAGDRVASITDGKELRALLARATRSGDEVLARAVAERALEMQSAETLNKFAEDRPHLDAAVERLWNAERAEDDSFGLTVSLMGLRPEELGSMSFSSIEAMAQNGEPMGVTA